MLAQRIQALYNIVDSLFMGRYAETGLTALSIIYPIQLLMIALAVGTGVGINTVMAARLGTGASKEADEYAGVGTPLAAALWFVLRPDGGLVHRRKRDGSQGKAKKMGASRLFYLDTPFLRAGA